MIRLCHSHLVVLGLFPEKPMKNPLLGILTPLPQAPSILMCWCWSPMVGTVCELWGIVSPVHHRRHANSLQRVQDLHSVFWGRWELLVCLPRMHIYTSSCLGVFKSPNLDSTYIIYPKFPIDLWYFHRRVVKCAFTEGCLSWPWLGLISCFRSMCRGASLSS